MLKAKYRLSKKKDFDRVFAEGVATFGKLLSVRSINNDLDFNRFGVMVGTKISKLAVRRNQIKRRIKYVLKKHETELLNHRDIIIIVFPLILAKEYHEVESDLLSCFKKAKLLK